MNLWQRFLLALRCFFHALKHGNIPLELKGYVANSIPLPPVEDHRPLLRVRYYSLSDGVTLAYRGRDPEQAKKVIYQGRQLFKDTDMEGVRIFQGKELKSTWGSWERELAPR